MDGLRKGRSMVWIICMAWKVSIWIQTRWYSASHMGRLGELLEDRRELDELDEYGLELDELEEQLGE